MIKITRFFSPEKMATSLGFLLVLTSQTVYPEVVQQKITTPRDFRIVSSTQTTPTTTSLVKNGITWVFSEPVQFGQFANGDYYVVDPGEGVTINSITPPSVSGAATVNGAMINPSTTTTQGFFETTSYLPYTDSINVALDVDATNPLVLHAGESLVSSITQPPNSVSRISDMAVLTCLSSKPPTGSFRPPYIGTDKTINFNESDINYNALANVTPASGAPSLSTTTAVFSGGWYDHISSWGAREMHPTNQMPEYGADMANEIGPALLLLHCSATNANKRDLLVHLLQYAIDISAFISTEGEYPANGGHGHGRKAVLALGAKVFGDTTMTAQLNANNYFQFAEDQHTFYITTNDWYPTRTVCGYGGNHCAEPVYQYNSIDHPVGTPEWNYNYDAPNLNDGRLTAPYRDYYDSNRGGLLSALMLGAESNWEWPAAFDYMERQSAWAMPCKMSGCYYISDQWVRDMYDLYWDTYR